MNAQAVCMCVCMCVCVCVCVHVCVRVCVCVCVCVLPLIEDASDAVEEAAVAARRSCDNRHARATRNRVALASYLRHQVINYESKETHIYQKRPR